MGYIDDNGQEITQGLAEIRLYFAEKVDYEGLDNSITDYFGQDRIDELEDEEFSISWFKAESALRYIKYKLEEWENYQFEDEDSGTDLD